MTDEISRKKALEAIRQERKWIDDNIDDAHLRFTMKAEAARINYIIRTMKE